MEPGKKFRILIVLTPPLHPNSGGVQMSTWKLGRYFSDKGMKVAIFSFSNQGHLKQEFATLLWDKHEGGKSNRVNLEQLFL